MYTYVASIMLVTMTLDGWCALPIFPFLHVTAAHNLIISLCLEPQHMQQWACLKATPTPAPILNCGRMCTCIGPQQQKQTQLLAVCTMVLNQDYRLRNAETWECQPSDLTCFSAGIAHVRLIRCRIMKHDILYYSNILLRRKCHLQLNDIFDSTKLEAVLRSRSNAVWSLKAFQSSIICFCYYSSYIKVD
jgi:hypothetical protein